MANGSRTYYWMKAFILTHKEAGLNMPECLIRLQKHLKLGYSRDLYLMTREVYYNGKA